LIKYEQKRSQLSFLPETNSQQPQVIQETELDQSQEKYHNLLETLHSYNLNDLTPMQALSTLDELQKNNPL
jgi:hypothetical protein